MPTVEFGVKGAGKVQDELVSQGKAAEVSARKQGKIGQTWHVNATEAKQYDRLVKQIVCQNETAQERYNRKLRDARIALAGNTREAELLKRETVRLKKEYDKQVKSEKGLLELRTPALKAAGKATNEMATATTTSAESLERQNTAFGEAGVKKIGKYVAAIGGVAVAMRAVSSVIGTVQENNAKAVESLEKMESISKRLNQVAFNAKDLSGNTGKADRLARTFGVDREEVSGLLFAARSEGIHPDTVNAILASSQTLDIPAATQVAGQLPKLFKKDRITGRQALNATLRASRESRLTFEQIGANAPRIAEGAALAGASLPETLAVEAVLSDRFATGSTTADRGKAFATKVGITEGLRGSGFLGAFRKIRDEYSSEQRKKFLGESQELNTFYQILGQEEQRVVKQTRSITQAIRQSGTRDSELSGALRRAQQDPKFSARFAKRQSEIELEVATENGYAIDEARRDAAQNRLQAKLIREDKSAINQTFVAGVTGTFDLFNASPETVATVGIGANRIYEKLTGNIDLLDPLSYFGQTDKQVQQDSNLMEKMLSQSIETNTLLKGMSGGISDTNRGIEGTNLKLSEINDNRGIVGTSE